MEWKTIPVSELPASRRGAPGTWHGFSQALRELPEGEAIWQALGSRKNIASVVSITSHMKSELPSRIYHTRLVREPEEGVWFWWTPRK